jgi:hypothetical protein
MGGAKAGRMLTATGLMSLLFLSIIAPQVAALGGEATIESASISIALSQQIETASFTYTFDVEEQSGQSADVTIQSTLSTIAGVLIESINESRTVPMNGQESFSVTFLPSPSVIRLSKQHSRGMQVQIRAPMSRHSTEPFSAWCRWT